MDRHFLTFKDPFLLQIMEIQLGGSLVVSAKEAIPGGRPYLLVFCKLNDSVVGSDLRRSIPSLQDARQVAGKRPGHEVLRAA